MHILFKEKLQVVFLHPESVGYQYNGMVQSSAISFTTDVSDNIFKPILEQGLATSDGEGYYSFIIKNVHAPFPFLDAQLLPLGVGRVGGFPWA
jgi:hypothetical protein